MILTDTQTKVLIVGAGPSGLMMAAQLLRHGVQPVIIDGKTGPTNQSKALAVQARSLEIYRQMGIIDTIMEGGKQAGGVTFHEEGKAFATLSLNNSGDQLTRFPFIHLYQQSKNERLLLDFLTRNCCPVYWETNLVSITQTAGNVEAGIQIGEHLASITCNWVIGADGAHSTVRKQLGIPFTGDTYAHEFYLADVELNNAELTGNEVQLYLSKKGFAGFFPMPEKNRYRIIGNLPDELDKRTDLKVGDVIAYLKKTTHIPINIAEEYWFTIYRLHHRMAEKFRDQRCFLIGDAAHIHSPVGGQGMNTGLQDAYNLAWKIAGVVNNQLDNKILESYASERMPVARGLLKTTDRIFSLIMGGGFFKLFVKNWIMPIVLKWAWHKKGLRGEFFKRVSQIGISYRDSAINLNVSQSTKIKAGDRLPYLEVFDEKRQQMTDLHEWCSKPGFTFIALGKLSDADLFMLAKWITQNYSPILNFYYLPPSQKNRHVFDALGVNANTGMSLIIRPDMYIGFVNDKVDTALMDNYLRNIVYVTAG